MESLLGTSLEDPAPWPSCRPFKGSWVGAGCCKDLPAAHKPTAEPCKRPGSRKRRRKPAPFSCRCSSSPSSKPKRPSRSRRPLSRHTGRHAHASADGNASQWRPDKRRSASHPSMSPGVDQGALIQSLMQADPQAAYQMLQPKAPEYKTVGNSLVQVGPGGVKEAYRAPDKPEAQDPFIRFLVQSGIDPMSPQGQNILRQRIQKETSHQPGVTVSYGAPVAGVDPSGKSVFFQPSKDGGAPPSSPEWLLRRKKPLTESQTRQRLSRRKCRQQRAPYLKPGSTLQVGRPDANPHSAGRGQLPRHA